MFCGRPAKLKQSSNELYTLLIQLEVKNIIREQ